MVYPKHHGSSHSVLSSVSLNKLCLNMFIKSSILYSKNVIISSLLNHQDVFANVIKLHFQASSYNDMAGHLNAQTVIFNDKASLSTYMNSCLH